MYRVGVIGLGYIGFDNFDSHYSAYVNNPKTEVAGVCDNMWRNPNDIYTIIAKMACRAMGGFVFTENTYIDYMEMIQKENLDIVSVCTPDETHCEIVCNIAPYVKAIYCEKPIALTLEDADKMIATCHKYKTILQVNHKRRFVRPKMRFSRGIIRTGTHAIDLLRQLFGECSAIEKDWGCFGLNQIDIEYVEDDKHIFELDCEHEDVLMTAKGVEHLVNCLDTGQSTVSSGEEARKTLEVLLQFEKLNTK